MTIKDLYNDIEILLGHIRDDYIREFEPNLKTAIWNIADEYQSHVRKYLLDSKTINEDCYVAIDTCEEEINRAYEDFRKNYPAMRDFLFELRNSMIDILKENREDLFESCMKYDSSNINYDQTDS